MQYIVEGKGKHRKFQCLGDMSRFCDEETGSDLSTYGVHMGQNSILATAICSLVEAGFKVTIRR